MALPSVTSRRVWPFWVGLLLVLAFLPQRYCAYGAVLRDPLVRLLSPVSGTLNTVGVRIRSAGRPPVEGTVDQLSEKVREQDGRILALEREVRELKRANAELRGLRERLGNSYVFKRPAVVGRSGDPAAGTLHLNMGTGDGVRVGLAVVEGASLVGRIVEAGPGSSVLRPITAVGTEANRNLLPVVLTPRQLPAGGLPAARRQPCLLEPVSPWLLVDDAVNRDLPAEVGDYARLSDTDGRDAWPAVVEGMIVGRVTAVEPNPDDTLRKRVEVRPLRHPSRLEAVTVIVPRTGEGGGDGGTGRRP